jgi:hypothetical protein
LADSKDDLVPGGGNGDAGNRVAFDYVKSQYFRVIRADGAIGAITPNGHIHMAFYSERPAIPRRVVNELTHEGVLGKEIEGETVTRGSIVREIDVDLFVAPEVAAQIYEWLGRKICELKELRDQESGRKQ